MDTIRSWLSFARMVCSIEHMINDSIDLLGHGYCSSILLRVAADIEWLVMDTMIS